MYGILTPTYVLWTASPITFGKMWKRPFSLNAIATTNWTVETETTAEEELKILSLWEQMIVSRKVIVEGSVNIQHATLQMCDVLVWYLVLQLTVLRVLNHCRLDARRGQRMHARVQWKMRFKIVSKRVPARAYRRLFLPNLEKELSVNAILKWKRELKMQSCSECKLYCLKHLRVKQDQH